MGPEVTAQACQGSTMDYDLGLPIVELAPFLSDPTSDAALAECKKAAEGLKAFGALVVRDPRASSRDNEQFQDLMQEYFAQADEVKQRDQRKDLGFQVGHTPEGQELPICAKDAECIAHMESLPAEHRAHPPTKPDAKERYFWRIGGRPQTTKFAELNAAPVIPAAFADRWEGVMNGWGGTLLAADATVLEMAAVGLGLPTDAFTRLMVNGPHLLAPTGSNLQRHGEGTILAGWHTDLSFLTIHGKSRFPGLFIWGRDGKKRAVKVPEGCLLCQAGQQLEWLTGGVVVAGFHEVIVTDKTVAAMERARAESRSTWRVSSTLFCHVASDNQLYPIEGHFAANDALYPRMLAGDQVAAVLKKLDLLNS